MKGLTGKCLVDFKEWMMTNPRFTKYLNVYFNELAIEFQWGVFLLFVDSKGWDLDVTKQSLPHGFDVSVWDSEGVEVYCLDDTIKSRPEAQQEAIKQFNILYNEEM